MPMHRVSIDTPTGDDADVTLSAAFAAIREEFEVPSQFPPAVLAEADEVAASVPDAWDGPMPEGVTDMRDLEFVTIDPAGSMHLDQAMCLTREGEGYRVRYAIADVPAVVRPGGAIDAEARARVETIYLPDGRCPLHPPVLSEGVASLLPGKDRRAFVWDIELGADGEPVASTVTRAMVRSTHRYDYVEVQGLIDGGTAPDGLQLLAEIGRLRVVAEARRGGASLPMPEQEVHSEDGHYVVEFRPPVPSEEWNAQISLLTGMVAAQIMLEAGVGILRTMPEPSSEDVEAFRRQAAALGVDWPQGQSYGDLIRSLDRSNPRHLALIHAATGLFRGAGYTAFDGQAPELAIHAAVAASYAHVTAPLRRLVDRFGLVLCAALEAGESVPDWVREALPLLPELMETGDHRASAVDRAATDAVEAAALAHRVGETFPAVVVRDRGDKGVIVSIDDPAVVASATGTAKAGSQVAVRLVEADPSKRRVALEISPTAAQ